MRYGFRSATLALAAALSVLGGGATALFGSCGPFSDVSGLVCTAVLRIYFTGVTAGTTPTTYSETDPVSRGQMALFLGRLYDQVKRTDGSVRLAQGLADQPSNYQYFDDIKDGASTSFPIGFATDGVHDYVASQGTTKIGIYEGSTGAFLGTFTTAATNNRMVCDGRFLYVTSTYGTTVKRIELRNGNVNDGWVSSLPAGTGDIVLALDNVVVATGSGVSIVNKFSQLITNVNLGGSVYGVAWDGAFVWASGGANGSQLFRIDIAGNVQPGFPVNLDGPANFYMANDGQNLWIPILDGGTAPAIEIVRMRLQPGQKVDKLGAPFSKATAVEGIAFNGRFIAAAWIVDFGCGNPPTAAAPAFYDAATHARISGGFLSCFEPDAFTIGFDGFGFRWLGYSAQGSLRMM